MVPDPSAHNWRLDMPAAEAFGTGLLAAALTRHAAVNAIVAVTDCQPASFAINSASSPSPPIQHILQWSRASTQQWLGVHVTRDLNTVADALSHPADVAGVTARMRQQGYRVVELKATGGDWDVLRHALSLPPEGWEW